MPCPAKNRPALVTGSRIIPQIGASSGADRRDAAIYAVATWLGAFPPAAIFVQCIHRLPVRGRALTKMNRRIAAIPAFAAGLALVLASVVPATAEDYAPFFAPWGSSYHYRDHWRHHKPRVRHHHRKRRQTHHVATREWPTDKAKIKGPYQIVVSIAKQQIALYGQDGLIARAGVSTGRPGRPTPMGVFSVLSKARWHRSNIYSGAPMPYMQRITWSGIAMHSGPRPGYPASHGCIRLPASFAIHMFHTTKVGTRVVVTREAVAPVAIASPKLFVPKPPDDIAAPETVAAVTTGKEATGKEVVSLAARSATAIKTVSAKTSDPATPPAETAPAVTPPLITGSIPLPPLAPKGALKRSNKPVSVFVSLKQKRVFVRQGFYALFDMPVTIADPDKPIGTHIYTAMGPTADGKAMRWSVVSIPSGYPHHRRHGAAAPPQGRGRRAGATRRLQRQRSARAHHAAAAGDRDDFRAAEARFLADRVGQPAQRRGGLLHRLHRDDALRAPARISQGSIRVGPCASRCRDLLGRAPGARFSSRDT